jgi:DNA polymerase-1
MRIGPFEFREVWGVDFEFRAPPGERPQPICLVARELASGRTVRLWEPDLRERKTPPYAIDRDSLVIAYYASAEMSCHLALGWPMPVNVLDLFTEFRNATNGRGTVAGNGLLGALIHYGLDAMDATEKDSMRELALRGGPWTSDEREALLTYCESDVRALEKLFGRMLPGLDIERALLRGRYMKAAARMEHCGVPIDTDALAILRANWSSVQERLIQRIDADYDVFDGRTFKRDHFAAWLIRTGTPWPRLSSGSLALDDDTFREMARAYPKVSPLRELRVALSQMRLADLAVGHDGRNRCLLSAFQARTGRNQPSNSKFIFGPSVWLRSLIRPEPGYGIAYVDWSQQEFGIAAALSGDNAMCAAYESGDPYLAFAKQAKAIPPEGTKQSHGAIRDLFKACALAVQYGMGADSLAQRIGRPVSDARTLLELHRKTYATFWRWSDAAVDHAMLHGWLGTVFGWTIHTSDRANARSLRNFPMQANGAEMLRLASSRGTEQGLQICAPVHDAILIEAPLDALDGAVALAQKIMADASSLVLGGVRLRSDVKVIRYPDRYEDERGRVMWRTVWDVLAEQNGEDVRSAHTWCAPMPQGCGTHAHPSNLISPL